MATKVAALAFAGGRTVVAPRECDVCATRSALWYCAADEANLCTACDTQVHSANPVSHRHERVRLSPNGATPTRLLRDCYSRGPEENAPKDHAPASCDPAASSRKRSRGTSKPYSHHLRKLTHLSNQLVKEENCNDNSELELFDFLDADEFLNDAGNQEVPSLSPVKSDSSPCWSSDLDQYMSSDDQEGGYHLAKDNSADSLAAFFKGKAAHSQHVIDNSDQLRVPDDHFRELDIDIDTATAPVDTDIDSPTAGDAFFFPGDIRGLDVGFERFAVPEIDLVDDFSLSSFDLALQNGLDAFEGVNNVNGGAATSEMAGVAACVAETQECKTKPPETTPHSDFLAGPFAKFFAQKYSTTDSQGDPAPMGPQRIKQQAKEMIQCCQYNNKTPVPSLQLNFKDVQAAWSDREEPWIIVGSDDSGSDDVGLVPDMDDGDHDRDARVLRYKEKRRNRLFSKTIRYEVRKVNAERRPRMKGRFVKRPTTATTSS